MNPVVSLGRSIPEQYIPHEELPEIADEEALRATAELIVPALKIFSVSALGKLRSKQTNENTHMERHTTHDGHQELDGDMRRKVMQELGEIPLIFKR